MNYRHAFHAGNHADALKHATLLALLERLKAKPKPIAAIDAFAGAGVYDLGLDPRAARTEEWRSGVGRVLDDRSPALDGYREALTTLNPRGGARIYPGSPRLIADRLGPDDKLLCVERHPDEATALRAALDGDKRARVYEQDGWAALLSFLPPTPRRGLVLIDPPFEQPGETDRLVRSLRDGLRRWASGVFALWRPIKSADDRVGVHAAFKQAAGDAPLVSLRLMVSPEGERGLIGSEMLVANPPFEVEAALARIVEALGAVLAAPSAEGGALDWLSPRR